MVSWEYTWVRVDVWKRRFLWEGEVSRGRKGCSWGKTSGEAEFAFCFVYGGGAAGEKVLIDLSKQKHHNLNPSRWDKVQMKSIKILKVVQMKICIGLFFFLIRRKLATTENYKTVEMLRNFVCICFRRDQIKSVTKHWHACTSPSWEVLKYQAVGRGNLDKLLRWDLDGPG